MSSDTYEGRPWRDEQTLRRLYNEKGLTQQEIADKLGCDRTTVYTWMGNFGIETNSRHRGDHDPPWRYESVLRSMYIDSGMDMAEIADELGCSPGTVNNWIDRFDIETRSGRALGGTDPDDRKDWVIEQYRSGATQESIADELGVARVTITRRLDEWGIEKRTQSEALSTRGHGGRLPYLRTDTNGAERVIDYRGKDADQRTVTTVVHRLAAVAWFGFDAVCENEVVRLSLVPWDIREDNLELMEHDEAAGYYGPRLGGDNGVVS